MSPTGTVSIETAWGVAEKTVYDLLQTFTDGKDGQTAFRGGLLPFHCNAWSLSTGGGDGEQTHSLCFGSLIMDAVIFGRYQEYDAGQAFAGKVLKMFLETSNVKQRVNVQWFRMASSGMPRIVPNVFIPAQQYGAATPVQRECFEVEFRCQMVFNSTEVYN